MVTNPAISIIIPSYNHSDYIGEAIESILSQTFADFELIIVDDGSTDNSPDIIKNYATKDSRIISIFQENNGGPSAAVNRGLEMARGSFVVAHPSDDRSHSNRLENLLHYLNTHDEYDLVGSFIEEIDSDGGLVLSNQKFESWFNVDIDFSDPKVWIWNNKVASPTLMFRRDFFKRYGNCNPELIYTQDWEFLIHSISMGAKLKILPIKFFQYRSHTNNLTNKNAKQVFLEYAYISSKYLNPWLSDKNLHNEVDSNVLQFINHSEFEALSKIERRNLVVFLFTKTESSFYDFQSKLSTLISPIFSQNMNSSLLEELSHQFSSEHLALKRIFRLFEQASEEELALNVALSEKDRLVTELNLIQNSMSWKLTSPLRWFKRCISNFK